MKKTIHKLAPKARFVRLTVPPVIGAALLGIEACGIEITSEIRNTMKESISAFRNVSLKLT
jgi:hypothetical protein